MLGLSDGLNGSGPGHGRPGHGGSRCLNGSGMGGQVAGHQRQGLDSIPGPYSTLLAMLAWPSLRMPLLSVLVLALPLLVLRQRAQNALEHTKY